MEGQGPNRLYGSWLDGVNGKVGAAVAWWEEAHAPAPLRPGGSAHDAPSDRHTIQSRSLLDRQSVATASATTRGYSTRRSSPCTRS